MTELVNGLEHRDEIRRLFAEYTDMLVEIEPTFAYYLELQKYDDELENLEDKYGPPRGRLWLARIDGEAAGCIALHPLDDERCELKRLYVLPKFRGHGLGRLLVDTMIDAARALGFRHILLDTLTPLQTAIRIYREKGFYDIPCYNNSPMVETYFLQLDL
jgi:GNAT superfamily N-acetyltransferase